MKFRKIIQKKRNKQFRYASFDDDTTSIVVKFDKNNRGTIVETKTSFYPIGYVSDTWSFNSNFSNFWKVLSNYKEK